MGNFRLEPLREFRNKAKPTKVRGAIIIISAESCKRFRRNVLGRFPGLTPWSILWEILGELSGRIPKVIFGGIPRKIPGRILNEITGNIQ